MYHSYVFTQCNYLVEVFIVIVFNKSTTQENEFQAVINLLASGNNTEIIQSEIGKNGMIFILPPKDICVFEYYYIVKGQVEYDNTIYCQCDSFDASKITQGHAIKALEDTVLLCISSSMGGFERSYNFNKVLTEQLKCIQKKDHYTFEHCKRVKELAFDVCKKLNLNHNELKDIVLAAYFHDVGKIQIIDDILNKPDALTADEYTQMKEHVVFSYEIIYKAINSEIADLILLHHERLDGSGYPKGLVGEHIPLSARILAVVDSYDAMTTDRVYKVGKDSKTAIQELYDLSHQYDHKVVQALDQVIHS